MEYRYLNHNGGFHHCIWLDNSKPGIRRGTHTRLSAPSSQGIAEQAGFVRVNYRGDLVLTDHMREWLDVAVHREYRISAHQRTGMALMFSHKADAMLFKLQWSR